MNAGLTGILQWLWVAMPTLLLIVLAAALLACCWWDLKTRTIPNWLNLAIAVPYSLMPVLVTVIISPPVIFRDKSKSLPTRLFRHRFVSW